MKNVVFVQPFYNNVWESIGLGYIIAYCQDRFFDLNPLFFQGNFDSDEVIIHAARRAEIAAFSCTSPAFAHAVRLARGMREVNPKIHTVFGGWHVSALQEQLLDLPEVDQIVIGEGEAAFLEILRGNRSPVVQGTKMSFEELPWPSRGAIKNERTVDLCESMNGKRITSFQANRVCPVACAFCAERIVTGRFHRKDNPIRSRRPSDVCREIAHVAETYRLNYFKFVDATFDISPEYVIDFCKEKIARNIDLEWECLIHASFANEEMFHWLKEANCNQVNVGVESGSDRILRDIKKGLRTETVRNVFAWARKYGIHRRGFFLLGMPNETEVDHRLTEKLIDEIEPDVVGFTILCPYPGSDLYDPKLHRDVDWEVTDEYSNDFWATPHFTNEELKEWQSYFTKKYSGLLCERQA